MAPRNTVTWRRPYTSIYNDNYKYGTNLYSDTLSECRKKTRPDSSLSFVSSSIPQTPTPVVEKDVPLRPLSPVVDTPTTTFQGSIFQNLMNSAFYSPYAKDVDTELDLQTTKKKTTTTTSTVTATSSLDRQPASKPAATTPTENPRPQSLCLYDDANYFVTKPKVIPPASVRLTDDDTKRRRKKQVVTETTTKISSSSEPTSNITTTTTTVNSPPQNGPNAVIYWKDQCHDLQSQVDILTQAMADMNTKLKGELSTIKGRLYNEIKDMNMSLDHSTLQSNELQKTVKRQANQLLELQSSYDDLQRHLQDSLDEVAGYQKRSLTLKKEMDRLRAEVEETLQKSPKA